MAVVGSAKERFQDRRTQYNGGIWTQTRAWLIKTDSKTDREDTVSGASGLPAYGEAHPAPIAATTYARDIFYEPIVEETATGWKATVTYTSERNFHATDPASDEVLVSWTSEIYQEPIWADTSGNAIVNSAGDYFIDPVPTREAAHLIAKITANVTSVPSWVLSYQNAINNNTITIGGLSIATGLAKLQRIEISERQYRGSTAFYKLSFEVHVHADGWALKPLDAGFRQLVSGKLEQIRNEGDNAEINSPALLDGNGAVLASPGPATAVFGSYSIYPSKDFTTLPGIS